MDGSVETSRPSLGPKPRLAPKPFSLQKTSAIRSINAPAAFAPTSKPTDVPPGNTSVPKGTLPVGARTPPQRTPAAGSRPASLSVQIKGEAGNQQREDQTTGVPKASTPTAQTPHVTDDPETDSKTGDSKNRAGTSDSTPKGATPTPAQKPQQTPTTGDPSPLSVSKHIPDDPKPTTPSPHAADSPVVAPAALQTSPPKESSGSNAAQRDDVVQTNHKAAAEKNEEDKTPVQKPEESGSASPSAANPAYQWGGTRRRLSSTLTSRFESNGPPVCPQPTVTASTAPNKDAVKKPVTPPPEQNPAAPEPSRGAGNEEEPIDYSGGDSIKRRISQLFDSSLRPEAAAKKEEPDIKAGAGGVKERIKNWVTDASSEDPKPPVVQRTRSRSVDSPASPVGDATPKRADVQVAVAPSTKDSQVKQPAETPVEARKGEAVEKRPHEGTTDLPGGQEQNKPVEAEVTLRRPNVSTEHAAADEGQAGSGESPALKRNNAKRRSVRFGIVETDDGAPPLILGSASDSSSEEDASEERGGGNAPASPPVYRRVGDFMKKDEESQRNEEEHEKRVDLEKRLKEEEDKRARLKLEEERKREDEEREKENARRREEVRRREEEKQREEEREKQRLKEQEVQRQKEEERGRQRLQEEEQKKQMEKLRADKEKELEQMRQKEEERARARQMEERLRLEEMERVRKEAEERERENQRRREEVEKVKARQRQEEEERIRRMELEIRMKQEKEEEKERMRQIEKQREDERRKQVEKERVEELERRRLKELEEKLRMEEAKTRDLISLDSKDLPLQSETLLSSVPNPSGPSENAAEIIYDDFSVKKPQIDVDFEDFSVKPRRWGSPAKVEKPPARGWRAEPVDEDVAVSADVRRQESKAPEKAVEPDRPAPTAATERPGEEEEEEEEERPVSAELQDEAEEEEKDSAEEADSTDGESEDGEEQVNSYCVNPEDKDTDALIDTSPDQQNGFCEPTNQPDSPESVPEHVPEDSPEDEDPTDSSPQPDFVPFPESSAPLLDTSAQRSKVALRRSQIRRAPSRSLRLAQTQTESQSWRVHDSTDEQNGSTKQEDSEPQGKQPKLHKASSPSTALNPAAQLIAQLKRRTSGGGAGKKEAKEEVKQREESESQQEEAAPAPVPRSPRKSPQLAGAALVLPPLGSDGGAVSSPAWLKELKSKKRLSQHETET